MAIIVESEKPKGRFLSGKLLVWLLILGVILGASYYLFFKRPDAIPNFASPSIFKETSQLSGVKLDPNTVVQNSTFQSLRSQVPPLPTPTTGRSNPFSPL